MKTTAPEEVLTRLAKAAKAVGDDEKARAAFERVYYEYPFSEQSAAAADELGNDPIVPGNPRIRREMARAERLFAARQYTPARAEFERLRDTELKGFRVVLMHGQLSTREKREAMAEFAAGGADVLVATSVIEVGIDVPNATVMLVEDAERYGISQLHQLRGRIGRGEHPSLCLLFGPKDSARLKALAKHSDGFRLAEIDLELRGEGELTGTRQSGLARFTFARLPDDAELLERARLRATTILDADPELDAPEHALLARALASAYGTEAMATVA